MMVNLHTDPLNNIHRHCDVANEKTGHSRSWLIVQRMPDPVDTVYRLVNIITREQITCSLQHMTNIW